MEENFNPVAVTHLLQHTLRSLCIHEESLWVYAVFWRILPRNYPPPKWAEEGSTYDRSRGNRRNWILAWEDGFCNFVAATIASETCYGDGKSSASTAPHANGSFATLQGLQPDLFFKMSHEIYNYGEGFIGKIAADHSHKWVYRELAEENVNMSPAWNNSTDGNFRQFPKTWEAQFRSGIKTIALISVREGVIQLGAVRKVMEDLSHVILLRKKFSYIENIPGVLLPHPSSSSSEFPSEGTSTEAEPSWQYQGCTLAEQEFYCHHHFNNQQPITMMKMITPSMSSLEALLSKLPAVVPPSQNHDHGLLHPAFIPIDLVGDDERQNGDYYRRRNDIVGNGSGALSATSSCSCPDHCFHASPQTAHIHANHPPGY